MPTRAWAWHPIGDIVTGMTVNELIDEAMKLPEGERLEVAERLFESLEGPPDPDAEQAWAVEIERRIKSIDSGKARFLSWEQSLRRRLLFGRNQSCNSKRRAI